MDELYIERCRDRDRACGLERDAWDDAGLRLLHEDDKAARETAVPFPRAHARELREAA